MGKNREPGVLSTHVRLVPIEANSETGIWCTLSVWETWDSEIGREAVPTGWQGELRELSQPQQWTVELFPWGNSRKRSKPCLGIISPEE